MTGVGRDVAPFMLDTAADVRAADAAKVHALITDDPLMAARALGLRPLKRFDAFAFIDGRRLFALGHMRASPEDVRGRVLAGCEFRFSTGRTPARIGAPLVTIRFGGNTVLSGSATAAVRCGEQCMSRCDLEPGSPRPPAPAGSA